MFKDSGLHIVLGLVDVVFAIYRTSFLVDQIGFIASSLKHACENSTLTGLRTNYAVSMFKYSTAGFSSLKSPG